MPAMTAREIDLSIAHTLAALRERHRPNEVCGLLIESNPRGAGHPSRQRLIRCPNRSTIPAKRFAVDPEDWLRVWRAADRVGARITGVWHTHPTGDAWLSAADRATAWPELTQLVAGRDGVRAFARHQQQWHVCFEHLASENVAR